MNVDELKAGDLAMCRDGKLAVIMGITNRPRNPVTIKMNGRSPDYVCHFDYIQAVIGTVDLAKFQEHSVDRRAEREEARAEMNSLFGQSLLPSNIKAMELKAGDSIRVRAPMGDEVVTFTGFNLNRPKYPISFTRNGRRFKGSFEMVLGKVA